MIHRRCSASRLVPLQRVESGILTRRHPAIPSPSQDFIWLLRMAKWPSISSWKIDFGEKQYSARQDFMMIPLWFRPFSAFFSGWQCTRMRTCEAGSWPMSPVPREKLPLTVPLTTNKHKVSYFQDQADNSSWPKAPAFPALVKPHKHFAGHHQSSSHTEAPLNILEALERKHTSLPFLPTFSSAAIGLEFP